jgi:hypothetical protein
LKTLCNGLKYVEFRDRSASLSFISHFPGAHARPTEPICKSLTPSLRVYRSIGQVVLQPAMLLDVWCENV